MYVEGYMGKEKFKNIRESLTFILFLKKINF